MIKENKVLVQSKLEKIKEVLLTEKENIHNLFPFEIHEDDVFIFDLSGLNEELKNINVNDTKDFTNYIFNKILESNSLVGAGGYLENRSIYRRSKVFDGIEPRTIHLGVDVWAEANTPLLAPLNSVVHSFKNNNSFGNYGGTIILEHNLNGLTFYTLYGHLSLDSLDGLKKGKRISRGVEFARLGNYEENGNWPPHLHFQIITDMQNLEGDFPGVAAPSEKEKYISICPDPNLILKIKALSRL